MNKRTKILLRVNEQAESFYKKSEQLGTLAAKSFLEQHIADRREKHRAQMTGLENIAETTLKVTDVLDYIKKQIARRQGWTNERGESFGESLKKYIEGTLKEEGVRDVCKSVGTDEQTEEGKREKQLIYLLLVRQLIRQIVVQYEYSINQ